MASSGKHCAAAAADLQGSAAFKTIAAFDQSLYCGRLRVVWTVRVFTRPCGRCPRGHALAVK
eukprot:7099733-Lingulodinium_polyedra.AAC.1